MKLIITFLFSFLLLQSSFAQSQDPDLNNNLLTELANKCKALQPGSSVMDAPCRDPYMQVPGAPIMAIGGKELTCCMLRDDASGGGSGSGDPISSDQMSKRDCRSKGGFPVGDKRRCVKPNTIIGIIAGKPEMYCCVKGRRR